MFKKCKNDNKMYSTVGGGRCDIIKVSLLRVLLLKKMSTLCHDSTMNETK